MSSEGLIAVREERTRIGNLEICKKTAIIATDEGAIAVHVETIEHQPRPYRGQRNYLALPTTRAAQPAIQYEPPEKGCCDYCCCECDGHHSWYDLQGKGCFMVMLLLLFYLVLGCIFLPFFVLYCICTLFGRSDE